ncbi:MAG: hypothetical protein SF339_23325 [Blastocatellia bacterium]|nr:hypothetical protein [Blastocatellia bacterium]
MSKEEIQELLRRNLAPDKRSVSTEEGLEIARAAARAAAEKGIACALAGGLAMHLYGFTRATTDVDMIADALLGWEAKESLSFGGETYLASTGAREIDLDWIVRDDFFRDFHVAALRDAVEAEERLRVVAPEWMVLLKYVSGRGKDQIDLLWLLQQPGLVDRDRVRSLLREVLGEKAAALPLREVERLFLLADTGG